MGKIFCCLIIVLLVSCTSSKVSNFQRTPVGEAWRVPDKDAAKILARLHKCGLFKKCAGTGSGYKNESEYQYIMDTYHAENITPLYARYSKADQKLYASLWGLDPKSPEAKIKGYKTAILQVKEKNGHKKLDPEKPESNTVYYFVIKICPPPKHCQDSLRNTNPLQVKEIL
jgi:hypothetical protein